mmetsp:Transcript_13380/g.18128  ORF Transcript_13380/g.18128 Transcript_13380/m.18128 type:complete len:87 (-) Transcript_13380:881-1141(-)
MTHNPNNHTVANITITVSTFPTFSGEPKLGAAVKVFKKSAVTYSDIATNCMTPDSSAIEATSLTKLLPLLTDLADIMHSQVVSDDV